MTTYKVLIFMGARPNVPKVWTLLRGLEVVESVSSHYGTRVVVVHSGQHYHELLGEGLARQFGIPVHKNLNIGSCSSDAEQLDNLHRRIDDVIEEVQPDCVVVIGDVNTSLAAALVASRRSLPVVHLEAGRRSGAWDPEEINRKVITSCSRYHLAPDQISVQNLLREGVDSQMVFLVGNTMAEAFLRHADPRCESTILERLGCRPKSYLLFSIHKSYNLSRLPLIVDLLDGISREVPVFFLCHPHTMQILHTYLAESHRQLEKVHLLDPLPYADLGRLLEESCCVVTDSAGMQEESTMAGVPCLTIGRGTARPETVLSGSNQIVGFDINRCLELLRQPRQPAGPPRYWDDKVSARLTGAFTRIFADIEAKRSYIRWQLRPGQEHTYPAS